MTTLIFNFYKYWILAILLLAHIDLSADDKIDNYFNRLDSLNFIDSEEKFKQIPSISKNAYSYLKEAENKPKVMRMIFVRHGRSTANEEDLIAGRINVDLIEKGSQQAQAVGQKLKCISYSVDAVYSSPSQRAIKTANLILEQLPHQPKILIDENLYEKNYGSFEGKSQKDAEYVKLKKIEKQQNSGPDKPFWEKASFVIHPDIESTAEIYKRAKQFLDNRWQNHLGQNVLVSTHGGLMKALVVALLAEQFFDLDYCVFNLANCAVLVVEISEEGIQLIATDGLSFTP